MSVGLDTTATIHAAVAALGDGPLDEARLLRHVAPLFAHHQLTYGDRIYLANHSLGRPLDAVADDVNEALQPWYAELGGAWNAWRDEMAAYQARFAVLAGAQRPDAIIPKNSAGQGLRAVLGTYDTPPRVVATRGEFDSLDVILREYANRGRITLRIVEPRDDGLFDAADIVAAIRAPTDLVVISEVMFNTGQRLADLPAIVATAHGAGARVLLDVYHSVGAFPVDVAALDVDFAVGGSYKYLRGGPGACFLYVAPRLLDQGLRTLDVGWFAKEAPFTYERPDPPRFAAGGEGWLESTPAVLPFYQSRAGQLLTLALRPQRLRAYSIEQQRRLKSLLENAGIRAAGASDDHGAFVVVRDRRATDLAEGLRARDVIVDARGPYLRLCPDILTTDEQLVRAADALAGLVGR